MYRRYIKSIMIMIMIMIMIIVINMLQRTSESRCSVRIVSKRIESKVAPPNLLDMSSLIMMLFFWKSTFVRFLIQLLECVILVRVFLILYKLPFRFKVATFYAFCSCCPDRFVSYACIY